MAAPYRFPDSWPSPPQPRSVPRPARCRWGTADRPRTRSAHSRRTTQQAPDQTPCAIPRMNLGAIHIEHDRSSGTRHRDSCSPMWSIRWVCIRTPQRHRSRHTARHREWSPEPRWQRSAPHDRTIPHPAAQNQAPPDSRGASRVSRSSAHRKLSTPRTPPIDQAWRSSAGWPIGCVLRWSPDQSPRRATRLMSWTPRHPTK